MPKYSIEQLRTIFTASNDFNEIFDAFEDALAQKIDDVELYRHLLGNSHLAAEEVCLFAEKLSDDFPALAYDTYMWLGSLFAATYAQKDNYELATRYYKKAAQSRPFETAPYLNLSDNYDANLNLPPLDELISFLSTGAEHCSETRLLTERLIFFYTLKGDDEWAEFYKKKLREG